MKILLGIILIITSILLISCQNSEQSSNISETNKEIQNNYKDERIVERMTYNEYVERYGNTFPSQNNESEVNMLLSSASTPLLSKDPDRTNNIQIVCERLNGYTLATGETFSYNDVCGPYGQSDGFKEAQILLSDGTHDEGYGGGVCQLSTTLYNAIKNIDGIEITERHHHSAPVAYVEEGEDATVSLQSNLDFKFINNTSNDIMFEAICDGENVTVNVYRK